MKTNRLKLVPVLLGLLASVAHCSSDDNAQGNGQGTDAATDVVTPSDDSSTPAPEMDSGTPTPVMDSTTTPVMDATTPSQDSSAPVSEAGSGPVTVEGVLTATALVPGSPTEPAIVGGYYQGATVCVDANDNGKCDSTETQTTTSSAGRFSLALPALAPLIADVGTTVTNTASNAKVATRTVFRASIDEVTEAPGNVVLSAMSTEVVRQTEANGSTYETEKENLATRLTVNATQVTPDQVLSDFNTLSGSAKVTVLRENNVLTDRFAYAITKLDRGDLYPDALAVPGGDPELKAIAAADGGVTAATATTAETRTAITFKEAEQAAFNVEAIPRYDHIFVVMLENKSTQAILGSAFAPKINAYLAAGNQAISYYATGNPSEPNYTALGGGDDFGITDDNQWNTDATGANAVQDLPLPDNTQPGLASSPFSTNPASVGTNHNITGKANLFNAITAHGMTWRTYSESMNPGQDFRTDSVADPGVIAQDHVYPPGTLAGNQATVGNPELVLPLPAGLYKTKHHPGMAFQNVRSEADFKFSNRTLGGGQWDIALKNTTKYAIPAGYDYDQLSSDLVSGDVGNLNFVVPDQCDDMHGISVTGTVLPTADAGLTTGVSASDCSSISNNQPVATGGAIIARGDNYVDSLVKKIQASAIWRNGQKKVAIVLMFDEGNATNAATEPFNSCCGWKASQGVTNAPLIPGTGGTWAPDTTIAQYSNGNKGHGMSVFGILTNQTAAPKHVQDSDSYSHFSFVRTLQDMFGLADPASDASYANRSKYTEKFIAQNILNLPEFAGSADTHYDSVRPMNHAYVIPATYVAKATADQSASRPAQTGPDKNQTNVWATK